MGAKGIALALAAAIATPTQAQDGYFDAEQPLTFECVRRIDNGELRAQFRSAYELMSPYGYITEGVGQIVSGHSTIIGPHRFLTSPEALPQILEGNIRLGQIASITPHQAEVLESENAEMREAIEALEESAERGYPFPDCNAQIA